LGLLHRVREHLPGDVVFMFQPGEEGYDGAGKMIDEGVLDAAGPRVKAAYGLNVSADAELGIATSRSGPYMAAFSAMTITVYGKGTHASRPATGKDPIQFGSMLVGLLPVTNYCLFDNFDTISDTRR